MEQKKIIFIVNPFSGTSKKVSFEDQVNQRLDHEKYVYEIHKTEYAGHAIKISKDAARRNVYMVVAVGGDGTVNEVGSGLVGSKTILGIIPAGSGNGFARHLRLPKKISKAIQIINSGKVLIIDTCTCNDKFYINVAGVGFDGYISNLIKGKSQRGQILYAFQMMKAVMNYESQKYEILLDGKLVANDQYYCVAIANASTYGYNFQIAPHASLTDGVLDVVFIKDAAMYQHLISLKDFFTGNAESIKHLEIIKAKSVVIKSQEFIQFHVDGEGDSIDQVMHFEIHPASLSVIVGS